MCSSLSADFDPTRRYSIPPAHLPYIPVLACVLKFVDPFARLYILYDAYSPVVERSNTRHSVSSLIVSANITPIPLERSDIILDLSDPNLAVGPRKRRPTERVLENGGPLVRKKATKNTKLDNHTLSTSSTPAPTPLAHSMPNPRQSTNNAASATSTDGRTSDGAEAFFKALPTLQYS